MGERVYFLSETSFGMCEDEKDKIFESDYVKKYKDNVVALHNKKEWKQSGDSAAFQGKHFEKLDADRDIFACVTGISAYDTDKFLFSQVVGDVSGVYSKNIVDGSEQFLIHSNSEKFGGLDYNKQTSELLASVKSNLFTSDIGVFDIKSNRLKNLTSGDSLDENPSFSRCRDRIFYNSRGIGRDSHMEFAGYGPSSVYMVSRDLTTFEEVLSDENNDYLKPREDSKSNLYYIKKPYKQKKSKGGVGILDVILSPFRLIFGFFKLIFFLSMQTNKKDRTRYQKSSGDNPAKYGNADKGRLTLFNESIDTEKEEKQNEKSGNKYAGFAPSSFELVRSDKNGEKQVIKKGVIDYALDDEDNIIFTNGKYIIKILPDGTEKVLYKGKRILGIGIETNGFAAVDSIFGQ